MLLALVWVPLWYFVVGLPFAAAARAIDPLDVLRAKRGAHGRFLSAHLEHGTFLSQPAFAVAQLLQAMGVLELIGGSPPETCSGSRTSWYVEWCFWRRSLEEKFSAAWQETEGKKHTVWRRIIGMSRTCRALHLYLRFGQALFLSCQVRGWRQTDG